MNEIDPVEARLRRDLGSVASATRAEGRWDQVAAQIEDPTSRELDYFTAPTPAPRERGFRPLAALVAFVAVLAGAFGVASLAGDDGASTPEGAVEELFEALSAEDPIGVLQALAPSERAVLVPILEQAANELDRLEVSEGEVDLRDVQGVELDVSDARLQARRVSDDYAVVGLDVRFRAALRLSGMFGQPVEALFEEQGSPGAIDADSRVRLQLATVREDGSWHVGLQATIAAAAQQSNGGPAPGDPGSAIAARGADSPEAAARQMLEALYAHDHRRVIELTAPWESAALHDWGAALVDALGSGLFGSEGELTLESLDLTTEDGDHGAVVVRPAAYRLTSRLSGVTTEISFDGECLRSTSSGESGPRSMEDCGPQLTDPFIGLIEVIYALDGWTEPRALVTVERDGQWFISVGRSIAQPVLDDMGTADPEQALRVVRSTFFGQPWVLAPDELWEACGVARPADDAPIERASDAYGRCMRQLPDDYAGSYGARFPLDLFLFGGAELEVAESGGSETTMVPTTVLGTETVPESVPASTAVPASTTVPVPTTTGP